MDKNLTAAIMIMMLAQTFIMAVQHHKLQARLDSNHERSDNLAVREYQLQKDIQSFTEERDAYQEQKRDEILEAIQRKEEGL